MGEQVALLAAGSEGRWQRARWWCELNLFRWPDGFPTSAPEGWEKMTQQERMHHPDFRQAWNSLSDVPSEDYLRAWQTLGFSGLPQKTDAEFDAWWRGQKWTTQGNSHAKMREEKNGNDTSNKSQE